MLSEAQCRQFREQGYLVVENVVDTEHLVALKAEYAELMDELYQQWYEQGL